MLLSLMASLIISLFLTSRITSKRKQRFILFSIFLFALSLLSFYFFQRYSNNYLFELEEFKGQETEMNEYFRGSVFTTEMSSYVSLHPEMIDDYPELVHATKNNKVDEVWKNSSIRNVQLNYSFLYFLFVVCAVSCVSLTTEILSRYPGKKPSPAVIDNRPPDNG